MLSSHSTVQSFLAGLSPQRAWFDRRTIHVGYMEAKLEMEHFPLHTFFLSSITIPQIFNIYLCIIQGDGTCKLCKSLFHRYTVSRLYFKNRHHFEKL
jgi:hypothetical protein